MNERHVRITRDKTAWSAVQEGSLFQYPYWMFLEGKDNLQIIRMTWPKQNHTDDPRYRWCLFGLFRTWMCKPVLVPWSKCFHFYVFCNRPRDRIVYSHGGSGSAFLIVHFPCVALLALGEKNTWNVRSCIHLTDIPVFWMRPVYRWYKLTNPYIPWTFLFVPHIIYNWVQQRGAGRP